MNLKFKHTSAADLTFKWTGQSISMSPNKRHNIIKPQDLHKNLNVSHKLNSHSYLLLACDDTKKKKEKKKKEDGQH